MKTKIKIIPTLVSVAVLAIASNSTWAAGTAAATPINNTASISYSVGTVSQTPIASAPGAGNSTPGTAGTPTTFVVDKKVDILVTSGAAVNVIPGTSGALTSITYTVRNEGNSTENYDLTPTQVAGDIFDTSACAVTTPASLPVSLAPDVNTTVTVQCTIPAADGTVVNGATSILDLEATINGVTATPLATSDTAGTVEVVFSDDTGTATDGADRNGSHSAENTYTINTADLTVAKTSAVLSDPTGQANPKRIPGAVVQYSISVSNAAGAATATGIVISDLVPSTLTITGTTISGGTSTTASAAGQNVTSAAFDLAAGQTATLLITATIL